MSKPACERKYVEFGSFQWQYLKKAPSLTTDKSSPSRLGTGRGQENLLDAKWLMAQFWADRNSGSRESTSFVTFKTYPSAWNWKLDGNFRFLENFRETTMVLYAYIFGWHGWRPSIVGGLWRGFEVEVFVIIPNELFDTPGKEPEFYLSIVILFLWNSSKLSFTHLGSIGIPNNFSASLIAPWQSTEGGLVRFSSIMTNFSNTHIEEFKGVFATIECRHKCEELTVE